VSAVQPGQVHLSIVTPEQVLFDGPVEWARVPLEDGLIGIWPGHDSLIATLGPGEVEYLAGGEVARLGVESGHLRVTESRCVVMVSLLAGEGEAAAPAAQADLLDEVARALGEVLPADAVRQVGGA
jgi:F-type H+-transporting ATPase subunit epsilon